MSERDRIIEDMQTPNALTFLARLVAAIRALLWRTP